jgi:hypothetical protein
MAREKKPEGAIVVKQSFASQISIWWHILVFLIGVPVGGIVAGLSMGMQNPIGLALIAVGALVHVIDVIVLIVKKIRVKKTSWTFYDGAVIYRKGRVFYSEELTRDMEYFPGIAISVRRSLKGKIFKYGEVSISIGAGEAGEIVMAGVKKPKKVQKELRAMVTTACTRTANMMSPYKMYPQMYRHVLGGYPAYYYSSMQMEGMKAGK